MSWGLSCVDEGNGTQDIVKARFTKHAVLYVSIHLLETYADNPDNDFFPGSGAEESSEQILNIPLCPLWIKTKKRKKGMLRGVQGFHQGVTRICERIGEFQPDCIFYSAGFDATAHDEGSTYQGIRRT